MGRGKWSTGVIMAAVALAASMVGTAAPAGAATGPVSATPASGTPQLAATGTFQQVRQLVQCGSTMYAVGTFNTITWNGTTYTRNNVFSFSATKPYTVTVLGPERGRDRQLHHVQPGLLHRLPGGASSAPWAGGRLRILPPSAPPPGR